MSCCPTCCLHAILVCQAEAANSPADSPGVCLSDAAQTAKRKGGVQLSNRSLGAPALGIHAAPARHPRPGREAAAVGGIQQAGRSLRGLLDSDCGCMVWTLSAKLTCIAIGPPYPCSATLGSAELVFMSLRAEGACKCPSQCPSQKVASQQPHYVPSEQHRPCCADLGRTLSYGGAEFKHALVEVAPRIV